jgi:hypothetical protein
LWRCRTNAEAGPAGGTPTSSRNPRGKTGQVERRHPVQQATQLIRDWVGDHPGRYAEMAYHPGMGSAIGPQFRIRLTEVNRDELNNIVGKPVTVTEDGTRDEDAAKIKRALERWTLGLFDAVPVEPVSPPSPK